MPRDHVVFLDAGTVDYGDISLKTFGRLGAFKSYLKTSPSQIYSRARHVDAVITNKCVFDARLLSRLKHLKVIHIAATGTNNVDLAAARRRGIAITNVSGYSTESVVQLTFAFILSLATNLAQFNLAVHDGRWSRSPFFTLPAFPISEISGKTLGIVGYGRIGKRVARIAKAFGMKVLIAKIPGLHYFSGKGPKRTSFDRTIQSADFLTLHAPLTPLTQDLINGRVLRSMKRGAYLINMARGGLINERALFRALKYGHLGGAAADVLCQEPPGRHNALLKAPRMLLTPHIAWASREARERLISEIARNIRAFQRGVRRNRVV